MLLLVVMVQGPSY